MPNDPTSVPERSLTQRMEALQRANAIRSRRARLKMDVKAGRESATAVLMDPPEWAATMTAFDLVLAMPKVGRVKANRVFIRARISPSKTLAGLTPRQRAELVSWLPTRTQAERRRALEATLATTTPVAT